MAVQQIRNANDVADIETILNRANITTTRNGLIRGGKYTKKSKKSSKPKKVKKAENIITKQKEKCLNLPKNE